MFLMFGFVAFMMASCTSNPTPVTEPEADSTTVVTEPADSVEVDTTVVETVTTEETTAE